MHKIRQKVRKNCFFQIIGGAMAPFGQEVATPMPLLYTTKVYQMLYKNRL